MKSTGIEYIPIKTKIRHKTQNVNAKHLRCQFIVSGRSVAPADLRPISMIYTYLSLFSGPQFDKQLVLKT